MIVTRDGIRMDERDKHCANADAAIRDSMERDGNLTSERRASRKKQFSPKNSTDAGMQIDASDRHF
jgi:hypothetical protein